MLALGSIEGNALNGGEEEEEDGEEEDDVVEREIERIRLSLDRDQQAAFDDAMDGKSIFLTGSAGVGKTQTTNAIITCLELRGKHVAKTSPTGIAATHIGGQTLMSLLALSPGLLDKLRWNKMGMGAIVDQVKNSDFMGIHSLVADEISMLDGNDLDIYEEQATRSAMKSGWKRPFGGVQLILVGDFLQLPPVDKKEKPMRWAFDANCWKRLNLSIHGLTTVHRQENREILWLIVQSWHRGLLGEGGGLLVR